MSKRLLFVIWLLVVAPLTYVLILLHVLPPGGIAIYFTTGLVFYLFVTRGNRRPSAVELFAYWLAMILGNYLFVLSGDTINQFNVKSTAELLGMTTGIWIRYFLRGREKRKNLPQKRKNQEEKRKNDEDEVLNEDGIPYEVIEDDFDQSLHSK